MRYTGFNELIRGELLADAGGRTCRELRDVLSLPCVSPCPERVKRLEAEIGLKRSEKRKRNDKEPGDRRHDEQEVHKEVHRP